MEEFEFATRMAGSSQASIKKLPSIVHTRQSQPQGKSQPTGVISGLLPAKAEVTALHRHKKKPVSGD